MTHFALAIVKGVQRTPQDTNFSEVGLDEVDLLSGGFNCIEYNLKTPALKGNAVYADSPLSDGRILLSGALGNVTEILRIEVTASTIVQLAAMLSRLGRFKQDCNDYWDTFTQIEPVYIKHQLVGEPAPRFALLYNIEIDADDPINPSEPTRTLTLSIERTLGFSPFCPGASPSLWYYYLNRLIVRSTSPLGLLITGNGGTNVGIARGTNLRNKIEYATVAIGAPTYNNHGAVNYVTIPAAGIPGDLPARVAINVDTTLAGATANDTIFFVWASSKPATYPPPGGVSPSQLSNNTAVPRTYFLIGTNGSPVTDATFVSDTGGVASVRSSLSRVQISFATGADSERIRWNSGYGGGTQAIQPSHMGLWRGQYRVFARMRQVNGSAGDITVYLKYGLGAASRTDTVTPTISGTTGATSGWPITDMGVITLPNVAGRSYSDLFTGKGLNLSLEENRFELWAARSTGVGVLYVCDLVFIPLDEPCLMCIPAMVTPTNGRGFLIDNTGYMGHGRTELVVVGLDGNVGNAEYRGRELFLTPGVENRVYAWGYDQSSLLSDPNLVINLMVNIMPQWSGIRDL